MQTPEGRKNIILNQNPKYSHIADFERCASVEELEQVLGAINRCQYQLISVTQDRRDIYTVFFRRCVLG